MAPKNAFYAQSGGVSAVINASACGVLQTARQHPEKIGTVYAGRNGIIGALTEDIIDTSIESEAAIAALKHTPGAAFGSCRYKLTSIHEHRAQYERLIEVFRAHDIAFFFYNGGGDSQDTAYKVSQIGAGLSYPIVCVGIPKTVDNDLLFARLRLSGEIRRDLNSRGGIRRHIDEPYLNQGIRFGGDGPACWLDDRGLRARC
jgi:ATP-dependent phosphofructokinase / diphosphate-dependent phosphofructokinase